MEAIKPPPPVRTCPKCALRFVSNKAKRKHRYGPGGSFCKLPHILRREGMVQVDGVWRKPLTRTQVLKGEAQSDAPEMGDSLLNGI